MLEILVVPACFLVVGLIGYRLGTPPRVAGGLVAVGCCHLLAFLGERQALDAEGRSAGLLHLVAQWLFLGGFLAVVWLAAAYPTSTPAPSLVAGAGLLTLGGPLLAALSGPTPPLVGGDRSLGPVWSVLPPGTSDVAGLALLALPLLAVVTFVVRYRRAEQRERTAMRWPMAGLAGVAALALAGTLLGQREEGAITVLFLLAAPVLPLSLAFGPVVRRLDALDADLARADEQLARVTRRQPAPGALAQLTPRELSVLEAMATGMSNPTIARSLHLSLSSVEKHATSIFRKLDVPAGAEVHRRVSAVVAYRDATERGVS